MRLRRIVLLCLLSLGVPLQGFAEMQYVDASCPMMQQAMEEMGGMSAEDMAAMMDAMDCHTDHDGMATSKPCPSGTSCQSVGPALVRELPVLAPLSVAQPPPPLAAALYDSHDPPLLWRPPAQI